MFLQKFRITLHVCFIIIHYFDWLIAADSEISLNFNMKCSIQDKTRFNNKVNM